MPLRGYAVTIVGLGLMGGSLALALRGKCARLVGVAHRPELAELAVRKDVVDACLALPEAVREADIVVLATPVRRIVSDIPELAAYTRPGALLIDLGSTKVQVVQAMNDLPEGLLAVGGHPMCGREVGGLESADPLLFIDSTFVLTPTARSTHDAITLAVDMVHAVGARPLVLDAAQHDQAVAVISHLPYLLASTLMHTEAQASAELPVVHDLASSGFRDTTRLAASQLEMMLDILLTNGAAIESALDRFEQTLAEARGLLRDPARLQCWMAEAQSRRREMFT